MSTVSEVISSLASRGSDPELPAPVYVQRGGLEAGLAVESMRRHMTDEGWQIFEGLGEAGYRLFGHNINESLTDVRQIIDRFDPATVVVQDKREWDVIPGDFREPEAKFTNVSALRECNDIFKVTILKDSHQRGWYHRDSADEMGCHAWIIYYHPALVKHLAPYVRTDHLIRTYHSLRRSDVPLFNMHRADRALLSGAIGRAYPERIEMVKNLRSYQRVDFHRHPGYHMNGTATPEFMKTLSQYKVAVCTSSIYGYALRKIIEATACGCVVITDLPEDDVLPAIDGNLIRLSRFTPRNRIGRRHEYSEAIREAIEKYDPERQKYYAQLAIDEYCHIRQGKVLAENIDALKQRYSW